MIKSKEMMAAREAEVSQATWRMLHSDFKRGWRSFLLTWIQGWQISGCSVPAWDSLITQRLHTWEFYKWFSRHSNHGLRENKSEIWACQVFHRNFPLCSCPLSGVLSPTEALPMYLPQYAKIFGYLSDFQRFHYIIFKEFWENSQINISTCIKI